MLRTRFIYAILASLAVIALGGLYQALRPEAPPEALSGAPAPIAAPATPEVPAADAAAPDAAGPTAADPTPP